jgi:hypothetical protein
MFFFDNNGIKKSIEVINALAKIAETGSEDNGRIFCHS